MQYLKRSRSPISIVIMLSFMLQATAPLVAAAKANPIPKQVVSSGSSQNLIVDDTLVSYISEIVEHAVEKNSYDQLPKSIQRCYAQITRSHKGFVTEDVIAALPMVVTYGCRRDRSI